jgi:hypothetical protein
MRLKPRAIWPSCACALSTMAGAKWKFDLRFLACHLGLFYSYDSMKSNLDLAYFKFLQGDWKFLASDMTGQG